jgi:pyruvate/2-oxoglutarate dehydrogenase complex dihydrolipoamide acyltransferase (E2) component
LLTESAYRALGGVTGALVSHADGVMAKLTPEQHALCRSLFAQLVTGERTRAVRSLNELKELVGGGATLDALLDELVSSRLLVVRVADGAAVVELVHESLITTWPTLWRWLDQSQEDGAFLSQLLSAAHQWDKNKRVNGLLWGGDMVAELQRFERRYEGKLPDLARAFSAEVALHAQRGQRLRRRLLSAAVALAVLLLIAAGVALVVIRSAQMTAEANARAALAAKTDAQTQLTERMQAEQSQKALSVKLQVLLRDLQAANAQLQQRGDELEQGKRELLAALTETEESRENAQRDRHTAERAAREARDQRRLAEYNARETQRLLEKELERTRRMNQELGTLIEELR